MNRAGHAAVVNIRLLLVGTAQGHASRAPQSPGPYASAGGVDGACEPLRGPRDRSRRAASDRSRAGRRSAGRRISHSRCSIRSRTSSRALMDVQVAQRSMRSSSRTSEAQPLNSFPFFLRRIRNFIFSSQPMLRKIASSATSISGSPPTAETRRRKMSGVIGHTPTARLIM